jgi:hypothetical protein
MSQKWWLALGSLLVLAFVVYLSIPRPERERWDRVGLSGSVTLDEQPIEVGRIKFSPAADTDGPIAWGSIERGRYKIPRSDGPAVGSYHVTFHVGPPPSKEDAIRFREKREKPAKRGLREPSTQSHSWPTVVVINKNGSHKLLDFHLRQTSNRTRASRSPGR